MSENEMVVKPGFDEFSELYKSHDLVLVYADQLADIETPVSVLARFVEDEDVFLLESVERGERFGRYSFIGINPRGIFSIEHGEPYYQERQKGAERRKLSFQKCPLDALKSLVGGMSVASSPDLPPLFGGAIGYIGYECVNRFERLPEPKTDPGTSEAVFMITDEAIVFDNVRHTIKVVVCTHKAEYTSAALAYEAAQRKIARIQFRLQIVPKFPVETEVTEQVKMQHHTPREEYCHNVDRAREYIRQGEVIQLVLSQKFSAPRNVAPLNLYRALRFINPSPYTFFLKLGDLVLAGSSPETMVKLENGRSSLRPIAGTRKRGLTDVEDRTLADELLKDEKERAEHLMLVDLGRNDLGRTAVPGSVQVKSFMNVERYSHVMHLVSDVDAILDKKSDVFDLVRTTFPAGTVSGAPKIRAMELIHELEPEARGVYGGAVGYFSYTGNMDLAIAIRTVEMRKEMIHVQVGAGIVFDSVPEKEYEETLNKGRALFSAIDLASHHLKIK